MTREILGWSVVAIFAVVGLVFLLALYCWVTGSDNPLDEDAHGDCPELPPGLVQNLLHAAATSPEAPRDHV